MLLAGRLSEGQDFPVGFGKNNVVTDHNTIIQTQFHEEMWIKCRIKGENCKINKQKFWKTLPKVQC